MADILSQFKTQLLTLTLDSFQNTTALLFPEAVQLQDQHRFGRTRTCELIHDRTITSPYWSINNPHYTTYVKVRVYYPLNSENTSTQEIICKDIKAIQRKIFDESIVNCPKGITCHFAVMEGQSTYVVRNQGFNSSAPGFQSWTDSMVAEIVFRVDHNIS